MLILGMETSARSISLALIDDSGLRGELMLNIEAHHSITLFYLLDTLFKQTGYAIGQVEAIAVSVGPGAFTSLRVGVSAAKGLGLALGKPLVGVSTLETLAWGLCYSQYYICPILDARKKQVYTALYHWQAGELIQILPEQLAEPAELDRLISKPVVFTGDAVAVYGDLLSQSFGLKAHFAPIPLRLPRAAWVAQLGWAKFKAGRQTDAQDLLPVYIRRPEAEEHKLRLSPNPA